MRLTGKTIIWALAAAAPLVSQQTTLPGDAPIQALSHPDNPQTQFLSKNPGWQAGAAQSGALYFTDPKTRGGAVILGGVTHQDSTTGAWTVNDAALSSTANGWRLDGGAYAVFIRQSGAGQHTVSQTYTDYSTKHASTLNVTVPTLTYANGLAFGFAQDRLNWTLQFTGGGFFQLRTVVGKRQGKGTHSFAVTSSENLAVNSQGQLVGDAHAGLTRATMVPKFGKPIACSAWSYSKGAASFTCDDSALTDKQFPYVIDPQSEITLTDSGTYNIYNWNDGQGNSGSQDAVINFSLTGLPSGIVITGVGCGFNVLDSNLDGGDNVQCAVTSTPPYGSTVIPCGS